MASPEQPTVDASSFEAMYRGEWRNLVAMAGALLGDVEAGADLAHEAMLRAYRDWAVVGTLDRPGAWVRRVLLNLCTDAVRRRSRERVVLQRVARQQTVSGSPDHAINEFWTSVRGLPDRQRAAVALRYIDDMSIEEIAAVLEVTPGTVKSTLHAARASLAKRLGTAEVTDER